MPRRFGGDRGAGGAEAFQAEAGADAEVDLGHVPDRAAGAGKADDIERGAHHAQAGDAVGDGRGHTVHFQFALARFE